MLTIAAAREGVPLPPFVEALFMLSIFEILIEAGIRMPRAIGQAISIVGALVLGDAVVNAGLISSPMIVVSAITAISSFLIPDMRSVLPFLRFFVLIAANILGIMGILLVVFFIFTYLSSIRSFGASYLAPYAPFYGSDMKDAAIRAPVWMMFKRPKSIIPDNADKSLFRMKINYRKKED